MQPKPTCFVAYPSKPPSLAETIEAAIRVIQGDGKVQIDGWKSTVPGGNFIITAICQAIDQRQVFICDVTTLNHNVLFELGYAIAKNKRVWILFDPSIERSTIDYNKFKLLTTIAYTEYINHLGIVSSFYKDEPYNDLDNTIHSVAIQSVINRQDPLTILYLKSGIETDASVRLTRRVANSTIPSIVDDPREVAIQPLSWYAQKGFSAYAVVVHFLSMAHKEARFHNAKNSFVSGLAFGFGKPLLMLAHTPYESPIDYRDHLKTHTTAAQCDDFASDWLHDIESNFAIKALKDGELDKRLKAQSELSNIAVGDSIAEQEPQALLDYFVITAAYNEALIARNAIFAGRKGSGKTAILYKLESAIGSDKRNHICVIKPVAYELEGVLRMLKQALPKSEKGYLIESFWKFLIYSELAKSIFNRLNLKPSYYVPNNKEKELLDFVAENSSIITPEFSIRLDAVVKKLEHLIPEDTAQNQRLKISELLHDTVIGRLREILGKLLEERNKVVILVDNLDKAWNQRSDFNVLCDLLFGLLGVSRRISQDFATTASWKMSVNLSLIIFLRSDILAQIFKQARERDKISYSRISWDDPELLISVIEKRFLASSNMLSKPDEIWSRYFCHTVRGMETRQFLIEHILPRPRDLIYLSNAALTRAVNRRHTKIEEIDIIDAQKQYSQYALDTLVAENSFQINAFEDMLYEFLESPEVIDRNHILRAMKASGIPEDQLDEIIELLCDSTFLAREVRKGEFEFIQNDRDKAKIATMAKKTAKKHVGHIEHFRIHKAFHAYLEIRPSSEQS